MKFSPDSSAALRLQQRLKEKKVELSSFLFSLSQSSACFELRRHNSSATVYKTENLGGATFFSLFFAMSQLNVIFCHFLSESLEKEKRKLASTLVVSKMCLFNYLMLI